MYSAAWRCSWFWLFPSFVGFWVMGLGFAWWVVVPPAIWIWMSLRERQWGLPISSLLLLALGSWLGISLIVGLLDGSSSVSGFAGAGFAVVVWVSAALLGSVLSRLDMCDVFLVMRGLVSVCALQGIATTLAIIAHPSPLDSFQLPGAALLSGIDSVAPWTTANFAYSSFFGDSVVRSAGLMATAAWSGGFAGISLLLLLIYRRALLVNGMRGWLWLFCFVFAALSLYFSYSRLSTLVVVVLGVYYIGVSLSLRMVPRGGRTIVNVLAVVVLVFTFVLAPWRDYVLEQDALRPGSSTTRIASYVSAVAAVSERGLATVIGGLGDKPDLDSATFGVGSESTLFSLLVRGGLIAVLLFVSFLVSRAWREINSGDPAMGLVILAVGVHSLAADLDIGTLTLAIALFSMNVDASSRNAALSHSQLSHCKRN